MTNTSIKSRKPVSDFATDLVLRGLIRLALFLPYRARLGFVGWLTAKVAFPWAGHSQRIRDNLAYVCPELTETQITEILRQVPDNFGRTLIEEYSGRQFVRRIQEMPILGPGYPAVEAAQKSDRPTILVTGHFGNYDVVRGAMVARGFRFGGLYRPFNNQRFDQHYRRALEAIGKPIFPRTRRGQTEMIKFLKSGGIIGLLSDQHMGHGAALEFFGKPAASALSAAKMALKYDALLVPVYAKRLANGVDFDIIFETPIPHSTPEKMTQAMNDSLEARIRADMGQWLWSHRRWKIGR